MPRWIFGSQGRLERCLANARKAGIPICFIGHELSGTGNPELIDQLAVILARGIRAEDSIYRYPPRRLIALLMDTRHEKVLPALHRVHQEMVAKANSTADEESEKPNVLYRTLVVECDRPEGGAVERDLITRLFEQEAHLIEADVHRRQGVPVEKFPVLEVVIAALHDDTDACTSPVNGRRYPIQTDTTGRVRSVVIDRCQYRTQDPKETSAAGLRAGQGAKIVWLDRLEGSEGPVGRIEDGLVFSGRSD